MKKTYLLIAPSVLFPFLLVVKRMYFKKELMMWIKGCFLFLEASQRIFIVALAFNMGGSKTISSDDGKQTDFEYKEKRSDGVDVYTYGVKMV